MKELEGADRIYLNAAEGWLGLGVWREAKEDLDRISPEHRSNPGVLRIRYEIFAKGRQWDQAVEIARKLTEISPEHPFGWTHLAYALHELKLTDAARNVLLPILDNFPQDYIMRYNLACYACQLGDLKEARDWLAKAITLSGKKNIHAMALEDPDLEPLRAEIAQG